MNTENKATEDIMRRIEKLLAIANDDRGNINEAAAAMSMANKLMAKHQLEHKDIIMASLLKGDDLVDEFLEATNAPKRVPKWQSNLVSTLAFYNDCHVRIYKDSKGKTKFKIYGMTSDVQLTLWMFDYVMGAINNLCNQWTRTSEFIDRPSYVSAVCAKREYKFGCTNSIYDKTTKEIQARKQTNTTTGNELAFVKLDALVKKYGVFNYDETESESTYHAASISGWADGAKIDLNVRGVDGGNKEETLLIGQ